MSTNPTASPIYFSILTFDDFGDVLLAQTAQGLTTARFGQYSREVWLERLEKLFPNRERIESIEATREARVQLQEYFSGDRTNFSVPLDFSLVKSTFQNEVLTALCEVKYGTLMTYGQLADKINNRGAVRAVGGALGANPIPIIVPCHRIVAGGGKLGGFTGGLEYKTKLLRLEGVIYPPSSLQTELF